MIRLSDYEPGKDIEIVVTGLRPGEKLYEELITYGEGIMPTSHEKIMVLRGTKTGNFTERSFSRGNFHDGKDDFRKKQHAQRSF